MRFTLHIFFLTLILIGCSKQNKNLVYVKNNSNIDLTDIDSVRTNLNGFWILENKLEFNEIVWLDFSHKRNSTYWEEIIYEKENEETKTWISDSSNAIVELVKTDNGTGLKFVYLTGQKIREIEKMTKTSFTMNGNIYLRHKGYDFLKNRKSY